MSIEPTYQPKPYAFDDPIAFPMYEKLEKEDLALFVSYSAKLLPVVDPDTVRQLGSVLHHFPDLKIIVGHGGWPWHLEVMAMAFNLSLIHIYMCIRDRLEEHYGRINAGTEKIP